MEFKDILDSLLSGYEQGGSQDVDSFLKEKGQELGLSEENLRKVEEASAFIDRLAAENESLQEAKKTGQNLKGWMMDKLEQSLQVVEPGEKKEQLVKALSEKMENIVNNQIKSME
jgi:plasmid stabilization system protein ParE